MGFFSFIIAIVFIIFTLSRLSSLSDQIQRLRYDLQMLRHNDTSKKDNVPLPKPRQKPNEPVRKEIASVYHDSHSDSDDHKLDQKALKTSGSSSEMIFGGNYLMKIGIVVVLLAIAFFVQHSIESGLITPLMRLVIGVVCGCMFLGVGKYFYKRYSYWSTGLTGAGLVTFVICIYISQHVFDFITSTEASLLMGCVVIVSGCFAYVYNSRFIGYSMILGGFATPALVSVGLHNYIALFSYIVILNIGIIGLSFLKNWKDLYMTSFIVTALYSMWFFPLMSVNVALIFHGVLSLIFLCTPYVYNLRFGVHMKDKDLLYMISHAVYMYAVVYWLFSSNITFEPYLGEAAFVLSIVYFLQGFVAYMFHKQDTALYTASFGIGIGYIALALPLEYGRYTLVFGWLIQSLLLFWVGAFKKSLFMRVYGYVIGIIALLYLVFGITDFKEVILGLANMRILMYSFGVAYIYCIHYLYVRYKVEVGESERDFMTLLSIGSHILSLILLFFVVNGLYYGGVFHNLTVSVSWILYSVLIMVIGLCWEKLVSFRVVSVCIFVASMIKVIGFETNLSTYAFTSVWNWQNLVYLMSIVIIYALLYLYYKLRTKDMHTESEIWEVSRIGASVLSVIWLFLLVDMYFDLYGGGGVLEDMVFSVVTSMYACLIIICGIWIGNKGLRVTGLVLFIMTLCKVLIFDIRSFETVHKIVTFLVVGILLVFTSFLYQKYQEKI